MRYCTQSIYSKSGRLLYHNVKIPLRNPQDKNRLLKLNEQRIQSG